jgi:hypothetical protein
VKTRYRNLTPRSNSPNTKRDAPGRGAGGALVSLCLVFPMNSRVFCGTVWSWIGGGGRGRGRIWDWRFSAAPSAIVGAISTSTDSGDRGGDVPSVSPDARESNEEDEEREDADATPPRPPLSESSGRSLTAIFLGGSSARVARVRAGTQRVRGGDGVFAHADVRWGPAGDGGWARACACVE